jgi:excisionase family DNA binding protein
MGATNQSSRKGKRRTANRAPATPDLLESRLYLRVREFCDLTGTPLPSCYALIAGGRIPGVVRIGNSIRIPVAALKGLAV